MSETPETRPSSNTASLDYTVAADAPSLAATPEEAPRRAFEDLPPAAQRALLEAEERRKEIDARQAALPKEVDGRGGLEPTRYEDWEIKGLTVDF
ncbi:DUF1674 domain-containing protein [Roseibium aestuarii]|uniref:DUF1674 domain-containing protein n=1 Tax=Roseibium aestuarii TaxID=2600299 RepID=A0ABW4K3V0_9HYPH|nr:DUF1674 domain-containing protein [Roseibium aestuarii]